MLGTAQETPEAYSVRFAELRRKLVDALGTDTVDVVLRRGVREIAAVYPDFKLTPIEGGSLQLTWDSDRQPGESEEFVRAAYSALYAVMLVILARILGREIAVRLAAAADAEAVLHGGPFGSAD
ncbi:MAG TPA: hypothetical protein VLS25_10300 [Dehalococcoidia bacterium]|nr:hypothetical protein [Dehalococcoidia bacterium]